MLSRPAIALAWLITVLLGSLVNAAIIDSFDEGLPLCLTFSAGASLPYLGAALWLAPRCRTFASLQALHFGLAVLTLLGLLPFFAGFAGFMVTYWPIGVVCHALLRSAPVGEQAATAVPPAS